MKQEFKDRIISYLYGVGAVFGAAVCKQNLEFLSSTCFFLNTEIESKPP